jgi:hypothetical protein
MTHPQTFFSSKCVYFEILNVNKHYIGMEPNSEAWGGGIQLYIFYLVQIKLFIFIFVVFSILDWSKSEGLEYFFFLHFRDQNIYFKNLPKHYIGMEPKVRLLRDPLRPFGPIFI